jgi:hypothetical protein
MGWIWVGDGVSNFFLIPRCLGSLGAVDSLTQGSGMPHMMTSLMKVRNVDLHFVIHTQ